jgi:hypothetical protein
MAAAQSVHRHHNRQHLTSTSIGHDDDDNGDRVPTKDIALDLVVRRQCISAVGVIWQKRRVVVTKDCIKFSKLPPDDMVLDDVSLLDIQSVDSYSSQGLSLEQEQEYHVQTLRVQCFIQAHTKVLLVAPSDPIAFVVTDRLSSIDSAFTFDPLKHCVLYEGRILDLHRTVEQLELTDGATVSVELRGAHQNFLDGSAEDSCKSLADETTQSSRMYKKGRVRGDTTHGWASASTRSISDIKALVSSKSQSDVGSTIYGEDHEEHECIVSVKCGEDEYRRTLVLSVNSEQEGQVFVDVVRRLAREKRKLERKRALRAKTFVARLQMNTYRYYYSTGGQVVSNLVIFMAFGVTVLQVQVDPNPETVDTRMRQDLKVVELFCTVGSVWGIRVWGIRTLQQNARIFLAPDSPFSRRSCLVSS